MKKALIPILAAIVAAAALFAVSCGEEATEQQNENPDGGTENTEFENADSETADDIESGNTIVSDDETDPTTETVPENDSEASEDEVAEDEVTEEFGDNEFVADWD